MIIESGSCLSFYIYICVDQIFSDTKYRLDVVCGFFGMLIMLLNVNV